MRLTRMATVKRRTLALSAAFVGLVCVSLAGAPPDAPTTYEFITVKYPSPYGTTLSGINNRHQVVGNTNGFPGGHAFLYEHGTFTDLNIPGATVTTVTGINDRGDIVGYYYPHLVKPGAAVSFIRSHDTVRSLSIPDEGNLETFGINDLGEVVGLYSQPGTGLSHGFVFDEGNLLDIAYPGSRLTRATGIADNGVVVGSAIPDQPVNGTVQIGYRYRDQSFETLIVPGSYIMNVGGTNNRETVVGSWADAQRFHGFVFQDGHYFTVDVPGSTNTFIWGINDHGDIVGAADADGVIGLPRRGRQGGGSYRFPSDDNETGHVETNDQPRQRYWGPSRQVDQKIQDREP